MKWRKATNKLILHHSASNKTTPISNIIAWHVKEGLAQVDDQHKIHSAYHYFILSDGTIVPDLPEMSVGWHSGDWQTNLTSIGVCVLGNFSVDAVEVHEQEAIEYLLTNLTRKFGLKYWQIYAHRNVRKFFNLLGTKTECPGENLYRRLPDIRRAVGIDLGQLKDNDPVTIREKPHAFEKPFNLFTTIINFIKHIKIGFRIGK